MFTQTKTRKKKNETTRTKKKNKRENILLRYWSNKNIYIELDRYYNDSKGKKMTMPNILIPVFN